MMNDMGRIKGMRKTTTTTTVVVATTTIPVVNFASILSAHLRQKKFKPKLLC
jgi:hypothetical protein